jgi:hypothetical protein
MNKPLGKAQGINLKYYSKNKNLFRDKYYNIELQENQVHVLLCLLNNDRPR